MEAILPVVGVESASREWATFRYACDLLYIMSANIPAKTTAGPAKETTVWVWPLNPAWISSGMTYVGDRLDNDVRPALACGLRAVQVRRGPWARIGPPSEEASGHSRVDSLIDLPARL